MLKMVKAEYSKLHHTFGKFLPVIAPIFTLFLVFLLTGGIENALPVGAWNWWYTILLPGMLAMICYLGMKKDKKMNYYNLLFLPISISRCLIGKVIYYSFGLLFANFMIFLGTWIGGALFGSTIPIIGDFCGFIFLSVAFLWEIPLYMLLSSRFGMFAVIFSCMVLSIGAPMVAGTNYWWVCPSSIPIRLMCPTLGILPNGLLVPADSELLSKGVILPGILLSLMWFVLLTYLTIFWFNRKAVKE